MTWLAYECAESLSKAGSSVYIILWKTLLERLMWK